jgi:YD repeat-containing protein
VHYTAQGRVRADTRREPGHEQEWVIAAYGYDGLGLLTSWTDAFGHVSRYRYDAHRRMVSRTDRRGYTFHNEYDAEGRCVREWGEDGLWDACVRYLPEERRAVATYSDGSTTTVFWDENGVLTDVIEPSGGRTRFVVDDEGRIAEEIDPLGNVTRWAYDERGGIVGRVTPQGHLLPPLDVEPNPPDPLSTSCATPMEWECGTRLAPRRPAVTGAPTG